MIKSFAFSGLFLFLLILYNSPALADVIFIANNDVPEVTLTSEEIKMIFLGRTTKWSNRMDIIVVLLKNESQKPFLKKYIKRSERQFICTWRRMVYTGQGLMPKSFETVDALIDHIANKQGSIGYIEEADLKKCKNFEKGKVKIITVK